MSSKAPKMVQPALRTITPLSFAAITNPYPSRRCYYQWNCCPPKTGLSCLPSHCHSPRQANTHTFFFQSTFLLRPLPSKVFSHISQARLYGYVDDIIKSLTDKIIYIYIPLYIFKQKTLFITKTQKKSHNRWFVQFQHFLFHSPSTFHYPFTHSTVVAFALNTIL